MLTFFEFFAYLFFWFSLRACILAKISCLRNSWPKPVLKVSRNFFFRLLSIQKQLQTRLLVQMFFIHRLFFSFCKKKTIEKSLSKLFWFFGLISRWDLKNPEKKLAWRKKIFFLKKTWIFTSKRYLISAFENIYAFIFTKKSIFWRKV